MYVCISEYVCIYIIIYNIFGYPAASMVDAHFPTQTARRSQAAAAFIVTQLSAFVPSPQQVARTEMQQAVLESVNGTLWSFSSLLWKITIEIVDMFIKTGDYP